MAIAFSFGCMLLFFYDLFYELIMESEYVRSMVAAAAECSLDEMLAVVCDPTQLLTWISALWVIPTTIYALPTEPKERSRVLRAAGFLPADSGDEILLEPGAWKVLLPQLLQTTVSKIQTDNSIDISTTPEMVEVSMERMSDDGNDDDCPYSISPIYHKNTTLPLEDPISNHETTKHIEESPLSSVEAEFFRVVSTRIQKMMNAKLAETSHLLVVAISSLTIFVLHQRNSASARNMLQKILELGIMAGTSSTAVASILGLVIPLFPPASSSQPQEPPSWLQKICGIASAVGLVKSSVPSSLSDIVTKQIPWRGTIAALVLYYFRHRFMASRKRRSGMPQGFS